MTGCITISCLDIFSWICPQTISFIEISIEAGILLGGKHEACGYVLDSYPASQKMSCNILQYLPCRSFHILKYPLGWTPSGQGRFQSCSSNQGLTMTTTTRWGLHLHAPKAWTIVFAFVAVMLQEAADRGRKGTVVIWFANSGHCCLSQQSQRRQGSLLEPEVCWPLLQRNNAVVNW